MFQSHKTQANWLMDYTVTRVLLDRITKSCRRKITNELSVFTLRANEIEMLTDLEVKVNFKLIKLKEILDYFKR